MKFKIKKIMFEYMKIFKLYTFYEINNRLQLNKTRILYENISIFDL